MIDAAVPRRSRSLAAVLTVAAVVSVVVYVVLPAGRPAALGSATIAGLSCFLAAGLIFGSARRPDAWPSARYLGWVILLLGLGITLFLVTDVTHHGHYEPRSSDAALLVFLIPLIGAARVEYRGHFRRVDRREIGIDVGLITGSFTAIAYVMLRPVGADATVAVSAATFAVLAAMPVTAFGALVLWVPSRGHVLQFALFLPLSVATILFGNVYTHGRYTGVSPFVDLTLILCPLAFAGLLTWVPGAAAPGAEPRTLRWARPVLTSISVVAACVALALVSVLDDPRRMSTEQSTMIIVALGLGIAARILANQIASTQAHQEVRAALEQKEAALHEADHALDRVREANETLRLSEEHLRLVFDAAVDGIVELDQHAVVLRANDSFCRMLNLDRQSIEGQPWSALAVATDGADASFAALLSTGQAHIQRREGQPLYLESRLSEIPTDPPRRLLLVRDVTAGRVADQTIRSLFQFLQDRDEDRTRLLRRTNSAIEAERNRVARDLHDGPVQGVSAASLSLEAALLMIKAGETDRGLEVLAKIRQELAEEADALRRLMSGLRPPVLEERGLIPALKETLARFGADHDVATEFEGSLTRPLPEDLETLAYRVVQEALSNAGKHADAVRVSVSDPRTCLNTVNQHGTYTLLGGTGKYAGISGHGTFRLHILIVAARSHGQCSQTEPPVAFELLIRASGPVHL